MSKIHASEFYPVSEVKLGSELYYLCELGKYLSVCGDQLSLDGVILDRILRKSRFWDYLRVAVYNGWVCDLTCSEAEILITSQNPVNMTTIVNRLYSEAAVKESKMEAKKRESDELYDLVTPKKYRTVFSEKTDTKWVWTKGTNMDEEVMNAVSFGGTNYVSQCFVSLVAYVAVKRFLTGNFVKFELILDESFLTNEHAVSDLILIEERTNALDWFESTYNINDDRLKNLGYEAWLYRGREFGFEQREYLPKEKFANFKRLGFDKGDVVGLYERKVSQRGNRVKSICDFHFAIVRDVNMTEVTLQLIKSKKTEYGYKKEFSELSTAVKDMFRGKDNFSTIRSGIEVYNWNDIGVEYMLDAEQFFIAPLQGDDFIELLVHNGEKEALLNLNELDFIYWLLKDYGVDFAEEKFLSRYFKKRNPVYFDFIGIPE